MMPQGCLPSLPSAPSIQLPSAPAAKNFDLFPYHEPANVHQSTKGAGISAVAIGCMVLTVICGIDFIMTADETVSRIRDGQSLNPHPMPDFAVQIYDYHNPLSLHSYGESYFRLRFSASSITHAGVARKVKQHIEIEKCTLPGSSVVAFCPKSKEPMNIQGSFGSETFQYIGIEVQPCWMYGHHENITCAPRAAIRDLFWGKDSDASMSVWIRNKNSRDMGGEWVAAPPSNFEENAWVAQEVLLQPTDWKVMNILSLQAETGSYLSFDSLSVRRRTWHEEDELMKAYVRVGYSSVKERVSVYSLTDFTELIGSTWALITLSLGSLAVLYNRYGDAIIPTIPAITTRPNNAQGGASGCNTSSGCSTSDCKIEIPSPPPRVATEPSLYTVL